VYVIGAVPDQVPSVVDKVCPTIPLPEITGDVRLLGGIAASENGFDTNGLFRYPYSIIRNFRQSI
jgi:hypothetical protein